MHSEYASKSDAFCSSQIALFKLESNMTRTLEDLNKFGLRQSDLLEVCGVNTESGVSPCKNFVSIIASDEKGYPNNCVAIESLWGQPNAKEKQIEVTGKILMALKMKPEEYISYTDLVQAHILMHDSHSIGNPMKEGITLEAGMSHNLFVNKRITTRLPYPYKTNCTDYLKLWKENGGHGPLTEKSWLQPKKQKLHPGLVALVQHQERWTAFETFVCKVDLLLEEDPLQIERSREGIISLLGGETFHCLSSLCLVE
ncbi:uncharacterized protein NPIL_36011 [Nephila pilipes]|uniref:Uncharacterized protein n=1 Tax=Nephila pilipes TaxID=299642 RepID=A0A8X6Q4I6_NEPPI|nr:uncharacterized protein NPIL_36011 [Nephila pilipes]